MEGEIALRQFVAIVCGPEYPLTALSKVFEKARMLINVASVKLLRIDNDAAYYAVCVRDFEFLDKLQRHLNTQLQEWNVVLMPPVLQNPSKLKVSFGSLGETLPETLSEDYLKTFFSFQGIALKDIAMCGESFVVTVAEKDVAPSIALHGRKINLSEVTIKRCWDTKATLEKARETVLKTRNFDSREHVRQQKRTRISAPDAAGSVSSLEPVPEPAAPIPNHEPIAPHAVADSLSLSSQSNSLPTEAFRSPIMSSSSADSLYTRLSQVFFPSGVIYMGTKEEFLKLTREAHESVPQNGRTDSGVQFVSQVLNSARAISRNDVVEHHLRPVAISYGWQEFRDGDVNWRQLYQEVRHKEASARELSGMKFWLLVSREDLAHKLRRAALEIGIPQHGAVRM